MSGTRLLRFGGLWLVLLGLPALAEPGRPRWRSILRDGLSARSHFRLAEGHARAGRCGAAVFHYRAALAERKLPKRLARRAQNQIRTCTGRAGWTPPRPRARWRPFPVAGLVPSRVRIPGGRVRVGSSAAERGLAVALCRRGLGKGAGRRCLRLPLGTERSVEWVHVPPFQIDRTEVSRGRYARCVRAGRCARLTASRTRGPAVRHPVVGVTAGEADAFCRFAGGRLPTESEWVAAARGFDLPVRLWPWGRHPAGVCPGRSGTRQGPVPVDAVRCDASLFGVLGLAGNVREWTRPDGARASTWTPGAAVPVRGGGAADAVWMQRVAVRRLVPPRTRSRDIGFRCIYPGRLSRRAGSRYGGPVIAE